jgi:hypothetical protein
MVDDMLSNELMMLGAVVAALGAGGLPVGEEPAGVIMPDLTGTDSAYVWVRTDFLKSRYRLTVTLDPGEGEAS